MKKIEFSGGTHIDQACEELVAAANESLMPVSGDFNGITIVGKPHESTAAELSAWYSEESRKRGEAYRQTDEYKAHEKARLQKAAEKKSAFAAAIDGAPPIELRNEADWNEAKANNQDPYGAATFRYAENWARIMQKRIAAGDTVAQAATATQYLADPEGISGFMYGCAVQALAHCWIHGEELRAWHNLSSMSV